MTIEITDAKLAADLQAISAQENRPVEAILRELITQYRTGTTTLSDDTLADEIRQMRHRAYARARRYWASVGDTAKANLTDTELDTQFGVFDEAGIPRLKSELDDHPLAPGSGAFIAQVIRTLGGVATPTTIDLASIREVLNRELAADSSAVGEPTHHGTQPNSD